MNRSDRRYRQAILASALALSAAAIFSPANAKPPASPKDVVAAKFAAVNRHSVADIVSLYAPDALVTASDFCKPRQGRADVERTYKALFSAIPDAFADVREYVAQDDRVAVRFVVQSRAPGQTFNVPIMDFFTVRNGLIVRDDGIFNNNGRPCTP